MKKYIILFLMIWSMYSSDDSHRWYLKRVVLCPYDIYSLDQEKLDKAEIQIYLSTLLKSNKVSMSKQRRKQISEVLYIGQKEYGVNYQEVLNIILLESKFKNVRSVRINQNGTYDYGYCQINEINIDNLYSKSANILSRYSLFYDIANRLDPSLNIMSCIIHISFLKHRTEGDNWIIAYNRGLNGSRKVVDKNENEYYRKYYLLLAQI